MPVEVVCPPIPVNDLSVLTTVVRGLREAGAIGTEESLIAGPGRCRRRAHQHPAPPERPPLGRAFAITTREFS